MTSKTNKLDGTEAGSRDRVKDRASPKQRIEPSPKKAQPDLRRGKHRSYVKYNTIRYWFLPISLTNIKKTDHIRCLGKDVGDGSHIHIISRIFLRAIGSVHYSKSIHISLTLGHPH